MGSLMAGWDSPVLKDPDSVKLGRNKSLTKEEIGMFKKLYGKSTEEECHNDDAPLSPSSTSKDSPKGKGSKKPSLSRNNSDIHSPPESPVEIKFGDWWTRSNWAFLNEPPLDKMEASAHKYTPQYDVAEIATK